MITSNKWKVSGTELEGMLEGIFRGKKLGKARLNRIENSAKIDVDNKLAEAEAKRQEESNSEKNYACNPLKNPEEELYRLTFEQNGIEYFKSHFREYDPSLGYWKLIKTNVIRKKIRDEASKAYWVGEKGKRGKSLGTTSNVNATITWAADGLFRDVEDIRNDHCLAFRTGVVDTRTGHQSSHSPDFYLTSAIPYDYTEGAECPEPMQRYIETSFDGNFDYVRAAISLMLDLTAPHRFIHLMGQSGSGKGLFIRLLQNLFSPDSQQSANSFEIFKDPDKVYQFVDGRRFIALPDVGEYVDKGLFTFYDLVECSRTAVRRLNESESDSKVYYTRYIVASTKPLKMDNNSSTGFDRRVFPLVTIPVAKESQSRTLELELIEALPDIASWALAMPRGLRDDIIENPTKYSDRAKQYFVDVAGSTSSTWAFINECLRPADIHGRRTPVSVGYLYKCYQAYCSAAMVRPKGLNNWKGEMKEFLPLNVVARRFVEGENIPTEWVWIEPVPDLFEGPAESLVCLVSQLSAENDGVEQFRRWGIAWGSLYPYDRRTLSADLASMQDMQNMHSGKTVKEISEKKSENDFDPSGSVENGSASTACPELTPSDSGGNGDISKIGVNSEAPPLANSPPDTPLPDESPPIIPIHFGPDDNLDDWGELVE